MKKQKAEVNSSIYASKYYTNAFEGKLDNFIKSFKSDQMGNRFEEVFRRADLKEGESV